MARFPTPGITPFEMVVQSFHPMPYTFWQKEHAMDTNRCPQPVRYLDYLALNSFERREELEQLRVPTLILRGGSDAVVNEDGVAELHRRIRGSTIEIVRGGGHALSVLKPHEVSTAINRFIADHIRRASDTDQVGEPADGRSSVMAPRWRDGRSDAAGSTMGLHPVLKCQRGLKRCHHRSIVHRFHAVAALTLEGSRQRPERGAGACASDRSVWRLRFSSSSSV